jgi:hypothetical protein
MPIRNGGISKLLSSIKTIYKWVIGLTTLIATIAAVVGLSHPVRRWVVDVYDHHAKVAFLVTAVIAVTLVVICIVLSAFLQNVSPRALDGHARILDSGPPAEFIERLDTATRVDMIFTTGQRFLQTHKRHLEAMIANNGHLRVLVAKPRSQFLRDVQDMESGPTWKRTDLSSEVHGAIQTLREIREFSKRGVIEFGTYTTHLRTSAVIIDNKFAWVVLTFPPLRTTETPCILAENTIHGKPNPVVDMAVSHIERIWDVLPQDSKLEI